MRAFLVLVVVLLLGAVGADLVTERVVTGRAESRLAAEGVSSPHLEAEGFPFLTQLVDGRFSRVRLTAAGVDVEQGRARDLVVTARDLTTPGDGRATAAAVRGTALVTYDEVLRRAGVRGVELAPEGDGRVRMSGTISLLGQTRDLAAVGRVTADGRAIKVVPTGFVLDGTEVGEQRLVDQLQGIYSLRYRLRDLPRGLRLTGLEPRQDGFRVVVTGTDVVLPTGR